MWSIESLLMSRDNGSAFIWFFYFYFFVLILYDHYMFILWKYITQKWVQDLGICSVHVCVCLCASSVSPSWYVKFVHWVRVILFLCYRLLSDISRLEAKVERLEAQIQAKDREIATITRTVSDICNFLGVKCFVRLVSMLNIRVNWCILLGSQSYCCF